MSYVGIVFVAIIPIVLLFWVAVRLFNFEYYGGGIGTIIGIICISLVTWGIVFWGKVTWFGVLQWLVIAGPIAIAIDLGVELWWQVEENNILVVNWILGILIAGIVLFQVGALPFIGSIPITMGEARWMADETEQHMDIFPFVSDPADNSIRMVTEEYALKRALLFDGPFGSNVEQEKANIIRVNGTLYWCVTYMRDRLLGSNGRFQENYIVGVILILLNVNDPNAQAIIIEPEPHEIDYANNLWYNSKINTLVYRQNQQYKYQRSYLTIDDSGKWVIVVTKWTKPGPFKPSIYGPLDVLDAGTGALIQSYEPSEFSTTPLYVTQVYCEDWLERVLDNWGRKRDLRYTDGVDFWAGSVINGRSNHRIEMSEDTRYIIHPDTGESVAFIGMHLRGMPTSLSGIFIASKESFDYYDLVNEGFISSDIAVQTLIGKSEIVARDRGSYEAAMPIAYTLNTTDGPRLVWYVPIYYNYSSTLEVAYFCIIDAKDTTKYAIVSAEGKDGQEMVYEACMQYKALFEMKTNDSYKVKKINSINSYVHNGETIFVMQMNDSMILRDSQQYLNSTEWNEVVLSQIGDEIKFQYMVDDDEIYWFTLYENLEIITLVPPAYAEISA